MIILTKIDGNQIIVNADEIELVESSHDSTITLKSGKKIIAKESAQEIIDRVIDYKRKCFSDILKNLPVVNVNEK